MIGKKIYSFKAIGGSRLVTGRVCAENMKDATNQVLEKIKGQGQMNVNVTELRNQNGGLDGARTRDLRRDRAAF